MVAGPTPQSASAGSGWRNSSERLGGTTNSPSGLPLVEASLARNLLPATPIVRVSPVSSGTRARSSLAISTAPPSSRRAQPPGLPHRHGVAAAEGARLVGGRAHHAAAADPTDQQRAAPQARVLQHLDAGEEGVEVGVEHAEARVVVGAERQAAHHDLAGRAPPVHALARRSWAPRRGQPVLPVPLPHAGNCVAGTCVR